MKKKILACLAAAALAASCSAVFAASDTAADTVVLGKIYTSNANHDYAEALAVKDGKYVYVGNVEGVQKYIEDGSTKIIKNDGLVLAGATEGHGHYVMFSTLGVKNLFIEANTPEEILECLKKQIAAYPNDPIYVSWGWNNIKMKESKFDLDMRTEIDKICPDKMVIMYDNSGHNPFINSKAIEAAGLTPESEFAGGFIGKRADGRLNGLVMDTASTYVASKTIAKTPFINEEEFGNAMKLAENMLHANGYTNTFDAATTVFGDFFYKELYNYDNKTGLNIYVEGSLKLDPFEDVDQRIADAAKYNAEYTSKHFRPDMIKLFADGECVESLTGWVLKPYKNGAYGSQVWQTEKFDYVVKNANEKGIGIHVHASGDAATKQAVEAFIKSEPTAATPCGVNSIGHSRHITEEVKDEMAKHHIISSTNIAWRAYLSSQEEFIDRNFDRDFYMEGYPVKSLTDRGIIVTSSTDYPANSGAPCDVPAILEVAVNGSLNPALSPNDPIHGLDPKEAVDLETAFDIMTINGARQLQIEKERGSIEVGKYADFVLYDKDMTALPKDEIHTAKVKSVYFEGKEVYEAPKAAEEEQK